MEEDTTDDGYGGAGEPPRPTSQPGGQEPSISEETLDVEPSIPDGVAVPRPLVVPDEAPEILPPEDEDDSADTAHDQPEPATASPSRSPVSPRGHEDDGLPL